LPSPELRRAASARDAIAAQIVEAVTGTTTYWDDMHEHVVGRAGMTGSAYHTRDQWLTDEHIAHPYVRQPDGSRMDAVRNLDTYSLSQQGPGENPGRSFRRKSSYGRGKPPPASRSTDREAAAETRSRP
jgi:hypothetical protein